MKEAVRIQIEDFSQDEEINALRAASKRMGGIGTFLGLVNLAVGILSATWLAVQLYGYLAHQLPMKRMRKQMLARELDRGRTQPAELGRMGVDE